MMFGDTLTQCDFALVYTSLKIKDKRQRIVISKGITRELFFFTQTHRAASAFQFKYFKKVFGKQFPNTKDEYKNLALAICCM